MSGPPEPEDGGFFVLLPEHDEHPSAIEVWTRNDAFAKSEGDQRRHWFLTGTHVEPPRSWTELRYGTSGKGSSRRLAVVDW